MYYSLYYLFFISLYYVKSLEVLHNETVRVRISTGEIEGYIDRNGKSHVHVFKGVPFAEPPVGNLRFSLPKEKSPWHFTWDAKQYRAACMANTTVATKLQKVISEDCLYMNIFADSRCTPNDSCPVIYYIHGGGFFWGSAVQFEDEFVIDRYASDRMVFLIPAYRLGMFGFWDFGDDTIVPRNLGLHDMIMSLKWVQKEILAFGGDPGRVTLMGNSAGASTIQFLSVSPAVPRDYYSNIVISSGSPTTFNGFNHSATNFIVKQSGCRENVSNPNNFSQIVDCLRQVDAFKLLDMAQLAESEDDVFFDGIVSDGPLFHNKTFTQLLSEWKQVPLFIGATKYEMYDHYKNITILCRKYGSIFDYSANRTIQACVDKYDNLMEKYKVRQMLIDSTHAEVYREAALNTRKGQPSYVWEFTMQGHNMHAGDISFMIGTHRPKVLTEEERVVDEFYEKMIKRFIRIGNPGEGWIPFDEQGRNYMVFDCKKINGKLFPPYLLKQKYYPQVVRFWLEDLANIETQERRSEQNAFLLPQLMVLDKSSNVQSYDYSKIALAISLMGVIMNILVIIFMFCFPTQKHYCDEKSYLLSKEQIVNTNVKRYT